MEVFTYVFAVSFITICVASACIAASAFAISGRKILIWLALFIFVYAFEQIIIFFNEYLTNNIPFQTSAFSGMEDSLLRLALGLAMNQSLWMAFCAFFNEKNKLLYIAPAIVFVACSLLVLLAPPIEGQLEKWLFYGARSAFMVWTVVYAAWKFYTTTSEEELAHYRRRLPQLVVYGSLIACMFFEDTIVMLLIDPNVVPSDILQYLYRRNTCESILVLAISGYTVMLSVQALRLKSEETPALTESDRQARARELLPYFAKRHALTPREQEILGYVLDGEDNYQIARNLQLAVGTVKTHVHNVFKKTGAHNREELIRTFWSEI